MNPYDPNDALSDKSDEYMSGNTLTSIDETPEEFPIDQVKLDLGRIHAVIAQKSNEFLSGDDFTSGEITSEDSAYVNIKFNDPNNTVDSGGNSEKKSKRNFGGNFGGNSRGTSGGNFEESSGGTSGGTSGGYFGESSGGVSGECSGGDSGRNTGACSTEEEPKDVFPKYVVESDTETQETTMTETTNMTESYLEEIKNEASIEDNIEIPKPTGSNELIHLLEEAKTLFEHPQKLKVRILDPIEVEFKTDVCPMTSSGMELQEIETKLRECHLVKSQNISKPGKQDVRLNLTLRDKCSKPEEVPREKPSSELEVHNPNLATNNFCELLYKSAFLNTTDETPAPPGVQQEQNSSKSQFSSSAFPESSNRKYVDDFLILSRAVQLLESRPSSHNIPTNFRGILGILALQQKLNELSSDKEELESRLYKCNLDFTEFIDILSDKARIISINNKEVANFIKILNLKVPELEKITASHTEALENIKYRFKERNVAKIIELRKQIEFYTLNVDKLSKKITKTNSDNVEIKQQMEGLDIDNLHYKNYFTKKVEEVREIMDNLQALNNELQHQLEQLQSSDLGKNENFKLKVPSLKEEIENISESIKQVRKDKNKYELENTELRKKLKQLILSKVMEKRNPEVPTTT